MLPTCNSFVHHILTPVSFLVLYLHVYRCENVSVTYMLVVKKKEKKSGLQNKQVEWPRPVQSELRVGSLKRPKHAVHDER